MLSTIRKHLSYPNIALTLALLFAMSGGAYAASKIIITSTKQIKPSVLKQLKGKNGVNGAPGIPGSSGPAGPQGPTGPAGTKGETGVNGTSAEATQFNGVKSPCTTGGVEIKTASPTASLCNGKEGKEGKEGSPWTAGGTLPTGKTETGTWSTIYAAAAEGDPMSSPVSFTIPLKTAPEAHYIKPLETPPAGSGCSGTFEKPEAAPGILCVFASGERFAKEFAPGYLVATSTMGSIVTIAATKPGVISAGGTWAVTAG
jgi:hypothetical protein